MILYPLAFHPIFKERVWGGRNLERLYHKALPPGVPIGESWEISDRRGDVSVIANGPLAGKDLHWLMEHHAAELLGTPHARPSTPAEQRIEDRGPRTKGRVTRHPTLDTLGTEGRFPLLLKILDAREKLSLQVHPPAIKAVELGGEPKTELWYVAHAAPEAELYVGLKNGVTPAEFERRTGDGTVADCFHRIPVRQGDAMFLPSGRVHALGAGLVIFEIQQNSDTTYRVFDWNRPGSDGNPRRLHVRESLASIDFTDFEPELVQARFESSGPLRKRLLADHALFEVEHWIVEADTKCALRCPSLQILAALEGELEVHGSGRPISLAPGQFCLLPACLNDPRAEARSAASFLRVQPGS